MSTISTEKPVALTIRQTDLRFLLDSCPRGAYARAVKRLDGPSYGGAVRGSAIHEVFAKYNEHLSREHRQTDWIAVDHIATDVLRNYPTLSIEQREDVLAQAETIKASYIFDATHYYGAEETLQYDLVLDDGRTVRITGRLDLLLVDADQATATVRDCKSNHALPPDSQISKDLQLTIYALLALENLPHIDRVRGELWFTRYGLLLPQKSEAVWDRDGMEAFKNHLRTILAHFLDAPRHEAIPSTWCQYCPLRRINECTLWRSYYGTVPPPPLSEERARRLARQVVVLEQAREQRLELLKQYVNEHGPLALGSGDAAETFAFHKRESEEIPATALLRILEDHFDLVGPQPLDELLTVKKTTKTYKNLRYRSELRGEFEDAASVKSSTTFGHKAAGDGE